VDKRGEAIGFMVNELTDVRTMAEFKQCVDKYIADVMMYFKQPAGLTLITEYMPLVAPNTDCNVTTGKDKKKRKHNKKLTAIDDHL
jgi:hypothetical protein